MSAKKESISGYRMNMSAECEMFINCSETS